MDAAFVSKILSLIPDRQPHAHAGAFFSPEEANSRHPERIRHLSGLLSWLSPLSALSKDDQKILGVLNAAGRPVHGGEDLDAGESLAEEDSEEAAIEDGGADALEYMEAETAAGVREEPRESALA